MTKSLFIPLYLISIFFNLNLFAQKIDTTSVEYLKIQSLYKDYKSLYEKGNYDEAVETINMAFNSYNSTYPNTSNKLRIEILKALSEHQEKFEDNLAMKLEVLEFYESKPKDYIVETAQTLYNIANQNILVNEYEKSLVYAKRALTFFKENNFGKENVRAVKKLLLSNYSNLAIRASHDYDYDEATIYLDSLKQVIIDVNGKESYDYAQLLLNQGIVFSSIGEESRAIPLYQESLALKTRLAGENNRGVIEDKSRLAGIYQSFGSEKKALELFQEVYEKQIENYNEISIFPIETLNKIAIIYMDLNELESAEKTLILAIERGSEFIGPGHSVTVDTKIRLANLYASQNRMDKASKIINELKPVVAEFYDDYKARSISNMAFIPLVEGNYKEALGMHYLALDLLNYKKEVFNPDVINTLDRIAAVHIDKKDYKEALKVKTEISEIYALNFGTFSKAYQSRLSSLISLNLKLENFKDAKKLLDIYNSYLLNNVKSYFTVLSSKDKENYINQVTNSGLKLSNIYNYFNKDENLKNTSVALNNILISKGLALKANTDVIKKLKILNDSSIDNLLQKYRKQRQLIDKEAQLLIVDRTPKFKEGKKLLDSLEHTLITVYREHYQDDLIIIKDWRETLLKEDELAIEFTRFPSLNYEDNSIVYAAYLYKKNWKEPKVINLFNEKDIKQFFTEKAHPNSLYSKRGSKSISTTVSKFRGDSIYNLVWKPLEIYANKSKKIYYSPEGILHKIAFAALPDNEGNLIAENFNIQQVSNTATLREKTSSPSLEDILLIGGVDYDFSPDNEHKKLTSEYNILESNLLLGNDYNRSIANSGFSYLIGTEEEVSAIQELIPESKTLKGKNASETAFKEMSGNSPSIIHIATHGFFFPKIKSNSQSNSNILKKAENPLLRSGLILANGNYAWQNGKNEFLEDDGILTAQEISNLDLSKTDLVILSACETGLGDIDSSEGVYGLQRAFKMAGVRSIIMSLWEVPDAETSEFMILFYSLWKELGDYKKAFSTTQLQMMNKYRDQPENWAAFVLLE